MQITKHKNGRITIVLTRDEAQDIYTDIRSDWSDSDSGLLSEAVYSGRVGAYEMEDRDLLADVPDNWTYWLDYFVLRAEGDSREVAEELRETDRDYMPDTVKVRIERWVPDAWQRAYILGEKAKQRAVNKYYKALKAKEEQGG